MTRPCPTAALAGWLCIAAGCLGDPPETVAPMCHATSDCDAAHGEVCEEGVCWGNPPAGSFAAVLSPPAARQDLVSLELPELAIPPSGQFGDLAFERALVLNGKLTAFCPAPLVNCDQTLLAGKVIVSRPARFPGGPGFRALATVATGQGFAIAVPKTLTGDAPFTVTLQPETSAVAGDRIASQQVPPLRTQISVTDNTSAPVFALGGPDLPAISGTLVDSLGRGIANYRVSALGHWDATEPVTEVSTVDFTDTAGAFSIALSDQLQPPVELVARPVSPATGAPAAATAHAGGIDPRTSSTVTITAPSDLGNSTTVSLAIQGADPGGTVGPIQGARVTVTGQTQPDAHQVWFSVADDEITGAGGTVQLTLLDGPNLGSTYQVSVAPPAGFDGALFSQKLALPSPPPIRLGARIAVSSRVVDASGAPVANAVVTVRPSLRFLWTLEPAPQAFAETLPPATATTGADGAYSLYVDAEIAQIPAGYDIEVDPPSTAQLPSYVVSDVAIDKDAAGRVTLPDLQVPSPAFVHGRAVDPDGRPVASAELKLYRGTTQADLCSQVAHAPATCPIPAQLQARNTSDSAGILRLDLPR